LSIGIGADKQALIEVTSGTDNWTGGFEHDVCHATVANGLAAETGMAGKDEG
jgi:hypothetical protein